MEGRVWLEERRVLDVEEDIDSEGLLRYFYYAGIIYIGNDLLQEAKDMFMRVMISFFFNVEWALYDQLSVFFFGGDR